jgi:hypothetical protein
MAVLNSKPGKYLNKEFFQSLLFFAFPLTVFYLFLAFPPSIKSTWRFYYLDFGFSILWVLFFALLFNKKGFIWEMLSLSGVLLLFAMPLIFKWQNPYEGDGLVGGIIPALDAAAYYTESQRLLLLGSHFSVWGTRRPLFAGFFATILSLNGNNLQGALAILVAINAVAVYFAAREVQRSLKYSWLAALFLMLCHIYYRNYIGVALTENLGFALGLLSFAFLLQGARKESLRISSFGLFVLTLALNARAGAFFILPAIVIWVGWAFRNKLEQWWRPVLSGVLAIAFGFGANAFITKLVGHPEGVSFSNYSESLYGIAVGYKGWEQVYADYPGIAESDILPRALEKIKADPFLFATGVMRSYLDYFGRFNGAFSFIYFGRSALHEFMNRALWTATGLGLVFAFVERKEKLNVLVLLSFLGILASASLLPPIDSSRMRVYAATIPMSIFIILKGLSLTGRLFDKGAANNGASVETGWTARDLGVPFSITIIAVCLVGPLVLKIFPREKQQFQKITCPPGQEEMTLHAGKCAGFSLVPDESVSESYLPSVRVADFMGSMETDYSGYSSFVVTLRSLRAGNTITLVTRFSPTSDKDLSSIILLVTPTPLSSGFHQLCVAPYPGESNRVSAPDYYLYFADIKDSAQTHPAVSFSNRYSYLINYGYNLILWSIIFGAILSSLGIASLSPGKRLLLLGNIALISAGAFVFLHSTGLAPLMWERISVQPQEIYSKRENSYFVKLPPMQQIAPGLLLLPAHLYENGELINANSNDAPLGLIAQLGGGRFAVSDGYLFFSASDNSDPRVSGKSYAIELPVAIRVRYQLIFYVLSLAGVFFYKKNW